MYEQETLPAQQDAPASRRIDAKVKWFNATKGFGFVTPTDGTADAFLPIAILRRAGYTDIREGASVACEVGESGKGPLVLTLLAVDNSTAVADGERRIADSGERPQSHTTLDGAVKWFEPVKGYGFMSPDVGGKDVFIHVTALRRSGIRVLDPGARVRVAVIDGKKGLEADRVEVI